VTDPTGEFRNTQLEKQLAGKLLAAGGAAAADGPLPIGDVVAAVMIGAAIGDALSSGSQQQNKGPEFVNMDTNALVAAIEQPTSAAGVAANSAIGDRTPIVSLQAQSEFLVKGNPAQLGAFMAEHGAVMRPDPSAAMLDSLTSRGLSTADAKVVGAGAEAGAATLTRDKDVLNKAPELTEKF
jgi:hypothetical protein